jgi:CPA1 family monovalent cation:H+ antiporter
LPLKINLEPETEFFFVLFVAPLIFQTSMQADNKIFRKFRGTILNMAFVLVILSVIGIGYTIHLLIPAIPLAVAFTLEGMVYLILGCQLPDILKNINSGTYPINLGEIVLYIILITLTFAVSRYIRAYFTLPGKVYDGETSKHRTYLIFSLAGARGAVTMASIISVPVFLSDGSDFPQRDLIILLATGVIICSLFITNFILPLVVGQNTGTDKEARETARELRNNITLLETQIE